MLQTDCTDDLMAGQVKSGRSERVKVDRPKERIHLFSPGPSTFIQMTVHFDPLPSSLAQKTVRFRP